MGHSNVKIDELAPKSFVDIKVSDRLDMVRPVPLFYWDSNVSKLNYHESVTFI